MSKKTPRPGRTLLIFFIATGVLYGLAAIGGTFKPKLGLDLEGGTSITLTVAEDAPTPTGEDLELARTIIDRRVNGSGVAEAEVSTSGNRQIVVDVPDKNAQDLVEEVSRTAELRFRLVAGVQGPVQAVEENPATPSPSPTGKPSGTPTSSPTSSPSGTSSSKPSSTPSGTAQRPVPGFAANADGDETPSDKPSPSILDSALPSTKGQTVEETLTWAASPPEAWQTKFATFTCPKDGEALPIDNPDQPLITCDEDGNRYLLTKAVIEGTSLSEASAGIQQGDINWSVSLELSNKANGRGNFTTISKALYANKGTNTPPTQFAIVLDGEVLSAPVFTNVITDGRSQISGSEDDPFTEESAKSLANSLSFGSLPIRFDEEPRLEIVGPSLAGDQLSAGILAGGIGLAIVMVYCLFYYRGLGIVVVASLFVAAAVTYATVLLLAETAGFTLTLPGIAGLIVGVGITADSFIVYFERIRDEMRDGKSMRVAVETGWTRARNTCLAADAVSLLAAVVLYIFAIGAIKGFAFALGISTLIDLAVFFWFTKPSVSLLAKYKFFNSGHKHSGLSAETLGVDSLPGQAQPSTAGGNL